MKPTLGSASFCRARSGCAFLAEADDYHSSEHHDGGKHLLPCKYVHSDDDADDDGYYRLDIAVHADQRRSDPLLSDRDEEIADECGADDEVGQFCVLCRRDTGPIDIYKSFQGQGS